MGMDVDGIMKQMKALKIEIERDEVERIVAEAQAKIAKSKGGPQLTFNKDADKQLQALQKAKEEKEKEEGGKDEMEQAEAMLQMSTVKVCVQFLEGILLENFTFGGEVFLLVCLNICMYCIKFDF